MPTLHRISSPQIPATLALLASAGGTARDTASWNQDRMTALALGDSASPAAVMPLSLRTLPIAPSSSTVPSRHLHAGWLSSNQFASRMSLRRQTKDTADQWPSLLPELDALLVLRRDESSLAARWYAHTGFHDILSIRCLYLDMTAPPETHLPPGRYQTQVVSVDSTPNPPAAAWQKQMLAVYQDVYANFGGAPLRHENFWIPALQNHYYRQHYQFQIVGLWSGESPPPPPPAAESSGGMDRSRIGHGVVMDRSWIGAGPVMERSGSGSEPSPPESRTSGKLMGYAVVAWSGWHSKRPRMDILELATRQWDTGVASELIRTTCQLAWSKNVKQVRAVISAHDPYRGHLTRSGFSDRWGYQMLAKWLNPQRYLDRIAATLPPELATTPLQIVSPGALPLTLRPPAPSAPTIQIQGDPRAITRLLLQRLDVTAALQGTTDASLISVATPKEITTLSGLFPWTPWVFHMLDFI